MKNGKKPTYSQRKLIEAWDYNAAEWLVVTDTPYEMTLIHKNEGTILKIPKTKERLLR